MSGAWHRALAFALTGERLPLPDRDAPDPVGLASDLDAAGWPSARIAAHGRSAAGAGERWPHPIPDDLRAGLGAAQLSAALTRTRERLGVLSLEVRPPSHRTALTADERRLLAEMPPHHVH